MLTGRWHSNGASSTALRVTAVNGGFNLDRLQDVLDLGLPAYAVTRSISGSWFTSPIIGADSSIPAVLLQDAVTISRDRPADFWIAFALPDTSPIATALQPNVFPDAPTLRAMKSLIVDNPDIDNNVATNDPYRVQDVRALMQRFLDASPASGSEVTQFFYNDPRLWDLPGLDVRFADGHWGQFTATIAPPPTTQTLGNEVKLNLLSSLASVDTLVNALDDQPSFSQQIPGLGTSTIGDVINPVQSFSQSIIQPLTNYLNQASVPDVDGLLGALKSGSATTGAIDTNFRQDGTQLLFDIDVHDEKTVASIPLGGEFGLGEFGLSSSLNVDLKGDFSIDMTLGIDVANLSDPENAFFIVIRQFSGSAFIQTYDLDVAVSLGFLDAAIEDGKVLIDATLSASVNDPNLDGKLSFGEITNHSFAELFDLSLTSSADIALPIRARIGTFDATANGTPRILVSDDDLFDATPPVVVTEDFDQILDFSSFDADSILAMLRSLATRPARDGAVGGL